MNSRNLHISYFYWNGSVSLVLRHPLKMSNFKRILYVSFICFNIFRYNAKDRMNMSSFIHNGNKSPPSVSKWRYAAIYLLVSLSCLIFLLFSINTRTLIMHVWVLSLSFKMNIGLYICTLQGLCRCVYIFYDNLYSSVVTVTRIQATGTRNRSSIAIRGLGIHSDSYTICMGAVSLGLKRAWSWPLTSSSSPPWSGA
jgi:hypothetical protein